MRMAATLDSCLLVSIGNDCTSVASEMSDEGLNFLAESGPLRMPLFRAPRLMPRNLRWRSSLSPDVIRRSVGPKPGSAIPKGLLCLLQLTQV